jgi:preprotein translocase subunit SecA
VQRGLNYAIVDEVDSILIDEARTPLIISGPADESPSCTCKINQLVPRCPQQKEESESRRFLGGREGQAGALSEDGHEHVEQPAARIGILCARARACTTPQHPARGASPECGAARACNIYQRDVDYIVRDGEVIIVDEFTGRTLPGRRWSDGLHQAVEAKEGVPSSARTRRWRRSPSRTTSACTRSCRHDRHGRHRGLRVPADLRAWKWWSSRRTGRWCARTSGPGVPDRGRQVRAIIEDIKDCARARQPVLVGTTSIETSELLPSC